MRRAGKRLPACASRSCSRAAARVEGSSHISLSTKTGTDRVSRAAVRELERERPADKAPRAPRKVAVTMGGARHAGESKAQPVRNVIEPPVRSFGAARRRAPRPAAEELRLHVALRSWRHPVRGRPPQVPGAGGGPSRADGRNAPTPSKSACTARLGPATSTRAWVTPGSAASRRPGRDDLGALRPTPARRRRPSPMPLVPPHHDHRAFARASDVIAAPWPPTAPTSPTRGHRRRAVLVVSIAGLADIDPGAMSTNLPGAAPRTGSR